MSLQSIQELMISSLCINKKKLRIRPEPRVRIPVEGLFSDDIFVLLEVGQPVTTKQQSLSKWVNDVLAANKHPLLQKRDEVIDSVRIKLPDQEKEMPLVVIMDTLAEMRRSQRRKTSPVIGSPQLVTTPEKSPVPQKRPRPADIPEIRERLESGCNGDISREEFMTFYEQLKKVGEQMFTDPVVNANMCGLSKGKYDMILVNYPDLALRYIGDQPQPKVQKQQVVISYNNQKELIDQMMMISAREYGINIKDLVVAQELFNEFVRMYMNQKQ